jgi:hypothetical protein
MERPSYNAGLAMKPAAALVLVLAAGCTPGYPECMAELPRSGAEVQAQRESILRELGEGFRVERVGEAFWVATNDTADSLASYRATIERMTRHLERHFFTRRPARPLRVYLFRDQAGYDAYCRVSYDRPPATPYGFYLARERKIVINISTGLGTLAHELVHPLLAEDLPGAPAWFNEGFASLYEQSVEREGAVSGLANWRLPGLQAGLRERRLPVLEDLLDLSPARFYGEDRAFHYAAARYLCLWLQERGWLASFYRDLKGGFAQDPTGRAALERTVGALLPRIEETWTRWVVSLRLPD